MTFSLVARCPRSGQFAVAVTSSSPAVAARCAFARAGVGAATTQNVTDPRLAPQLLDALESGLTAAAAIEKISGSASFPEFRQLTLIDTHGKTAVFSGARTLGVTGEARGINAAAAGNLLADNGVPQAVIDAFVASDPNLELGARVIEAMLAGLAAGGEAGPIKSAGLIVVDKQAWPLADLRVDWHDAPLHELARLWEIWQPQMHDYVTRALNPTAAPAYGVPGDE